MKHGLMSKSDLPITRDSAAQDLLLKGRELPKGSLLQLFLFKILNLFIKKLKR
jgi:hypothetical protein